MKYITNWYSDYEQHLLKLCCSYRAIIWHLGSWNHVVLTVHQHFFFSSKLYSKSTWQTFCNASKDIAAHHFECATAYWFREMNSQKPATLNYRSCVNDGGIQTTTERCFPLFLNWANFKIWTVQAQWSQSSREMCVCVCVYLDSCLRVSSHFSTTAHSYELFRYIWFGWLCIKWDLT